MSCAAHSEHPHCSVFHQRSASGQHQQAHSASADHEPTCLLSERSHQIEEALQTACHSVVSPLASAIRHQSHETSHGRLYQSLLAQIMLSCVLWMAGQLRQLTTRVAHVLPVSDDGGSTAEIVRVLGGPAVGDIRSRCLRLADDTGDEVALHHSYWHTSCHLTTGLAQVSNACPGWTLSCSKSCS